MSTRAACIAAILLAAGCGGREGLSEKEFGDYFFWAIESAELVWDECTDASDFRGAISAPAFDENSFLVYRVSDDGQSLIDQDCTAIDPATCVDGDLGIVFARDGELFLFDPPAALGTELAPGCRLTTDPLWTLDDQGQAIALDVSITFGLDGEAACEGVDENIAKTGTNEFGIDGCVATIEVVGDFYARRSAP